jgi:hypothetical protein
MRTEIGPYEARIIANDIKTLCDKMAEYNSKERPTEADRSWIIGTMKAQSFILALDLKHVFNVEHTESEI